MRLYYGTYGHRLSGKLYVYWGSDNLRTGEQVVAPVTNKKTGKTYDTMFTIARALNIKNAEGEVERLENKGIFIKTIGGRDTLSLPGNKVINPDTGERKFKYKKDWAADSERRYEEKKNLRLEQSEYKRLFSLPGGSAPVVRPSAQLKGPVNRNTATAARNSLRARKRVSMGTDSQKERLRAMRINRRPRED